MLIFGRFYDRQLENATALTERWYLGREEVVITVSGAGSGKVRARNCTAIKVDERVKARAYGYPYIPPRQIKKGVKTSKR